MSHTIPSAYADNAAFRSVVEHLDENGLRFSLDSERPMIHLAFGDAKSTYHCAAFIDSKGEVFQFHARLPLHVPELRRAAAAEAVVRANYGMKVGCFDMDCSDGEVIFRTYVVCKGRPIAGETVEHITGCTVAMCDRYLHAFTAVCYEGTSPAEAIREAESRLPRGLMERLREAADERGCDGSSGLLASNLAAEFLQRTEEAFGGGSTDGESMDDAEEGDAEEGAAE